MQVSAYRQFVLSARCAVAGVSPLGGGSGEHRFSLLAVAFGTSSFGVWSSRRCRLGELTLGWCVPAPRHDFTLGWWRQASAIRYGLARRLPRGGHDLISP